MHSDSGGMVSLCLSEVTGRRGHGEVDVQAWRSLGRTVGGLFLMCEKEAGQRQKI